MPRTHILRELTGKGLRLDKPAQLNKAGKVIDKTIKKVKTKAKAPVIALKELVTKKEEPVESFEKEEVQQLELREDLGDDEDDCDDDELVHPHNVPLPFDLIKKAVEKPIKKTAPTTSKKGKGKKGKKKSK